MATEKAYRLDLTKTLLSLDKRNKELYSTFTDEQKKEFAPFVYMKFMASAPDKYAEYSLLTTNETVNVHFWDLTAEKELQVKLLSMCGTGEKTYHKWIGGKKEKGVSNTLKDFVHDIFKLKNWHPNNVEVNLYLSLLTEEQLLDLCNEHGKSKEDTKKLVSEFNKLEM